MSDNNILRVGTDCSGIEAPIQALKQLEIPFKHVFSSEIDKYCIQSIKANYNPEILFGDKEGSFPEGDITKRNIEYVPDIDLYVCGFPCQPFSIAGKRKGLKDKRGNVFWSCLEVIETKQPKYFILENVKGLLSHDKGNTWNIIWNAVKELEKYNYNINWKILNTKDYGIPQNRERLFIVGVKNKDFEWPEKRKMDDIKDYVDWNNKQKNLKVKLPHNNFIKDGIFIDLAFARRRIFPNSNKYCQCLNTRCSVWCLPLQRYASNEEVLNLQGFPKTFIKSSNISNYQFRKQIGNSISTNVLYFLFLKLL